MATLSDLIHKNRSYRQFDEGYPIKKETLVEEVRIEQMSENGDISYWRDKDSVHHVPKRQLDELIIS